MEDGLNMALRVKRESEHSGGTMGRGPSIAQPLEEEQAL